MRMCEYANNLLDMGLLVFSTDNNRRIVYGNGDYSAFLFYFDNISSSYFCISFLNLIGDRVEQIKLESKIIYIKTYIEKIQSIEPFMTIRWR
jgi:hypothetical protein